MLCEAFGSLLQSGRSEFNARFAVARKLYPDLNAEAFSAFLAGPVNDLVAAVDRVSPGRAAETAASAYDLALEAHGQRMADSGGGGGLMAEAWRRILVPAATLVALAPQRMLAGVCNALHHLHKTAGARPGQWMSDLEKFAGESADVETFLRLGQVAAWRAGLAHFRQSALAVADGLPERLALLAVGAGPSSRWTEVQDRLRADPWFDPAAVKQGGQGLRLARRCGAFSGFGGLFSQPPAVVSAHGDFLVASGDGCWLLTADVFGATFHSASEEEFLTAPKEPPPKALQVEENKITHRGKMIEFPEFSDFSGFAANETTLALTSAFTHAVLLVALT